jgi:hypothetical protein
LYCLNLQAGCDCCVFTFTTWYYRKKFTYHLFFKSTIQHNGCEIMFRRLKWIHMGNLGVSKLSYLELLYGFWWHIIWEFLSFKTEFPFSLCGSSSIPPFQKF